MNECITFCEKFGSDSVYKSCGNNIVVLKKLLQTRTNEKRKNIHDVRFAKFRADTLQVICIFSKTNPRIQSISTRNTIFTGIQLLYKVGNIMCIDNYDTNLDEVCTTGIHYFKSVEAAFHCELPNGYTGELITYYDDGKIEKKYNYQNGKIHGECTIWKHNGTTDLKCRFEYGKLIEWFSPTANEIKTFTKEYKPIIIKKLNN